MSRDDSKECKENSECDSQSASYFIHTPQASQTAQKHSCLHSKREPRGWVLTREAAMVLSGSCQTASGTQPTVVFKNVGYMRQKAGFESVLSLPHM